MHGWVNYVLVVDKSSLEMKIDEFHADWPRPISVILRITSGVFEIFPLGSLYFRLSCHCTKSGGLRSFRMYYFSF